MPILTLNFRIFDLYSILDIPPVPVNVKVRFLMKKIKTMLLRRKKNYLIRFYQKSDFYFNNFM